MKIIFLDHYGVIVTSLVSKIRNKDDFPSIEEIKTSKILDPFNADCVENLNDILSQTNCEIVITSDWTKSIPFDTICEFYLNQGIIKSPIGYIKNGKNIRKSRVDGIKKWIIDNNIQKYVCVDDIYLDIDRFIWCRDPSIGINNNIKIEILNLLN